MSFLFCKGFPTGWKSLSIWRFFFSFYLAERWEYWDKSLWQRWWRQILMAFWMRSISFRTSWLKALHSFIRRIGLPTCRSCIKSAIPHSHMAFAEAPQWAPRPSRASFTWGGHNKRTRSAATGSSWARWLCFRLCWRLALTSIESSSHRSIDRQ